MTEFVTANGRIFKCRDITTKGGNVSITVENQDACGLQDFFRNVTELTVSYEKTGSSSNLPEEPELDKPHGIFRNLLPGPVSMNTDGTVTVEMHIMTESEHRMEALEKSQAEQDAVIAEIMFGKQ